MLSLINYYVRWWDMMFLGKTPQTLLAMKVYHKKHKSDSILKFEELVQLVKEIFFKRLVQDSVKKTLNPHQVAKRRTLWCTRSLFLLFNCVFISRMTNGRNWWFDVSSRMFLECWNSLHVLSWKQMSISLARQEFCLAT